jgi:hypothetical protein
MFSMLDSPGRGRKTLHGHGQTMSLFEYRLTKGMLEGNASLRSNRTMGDMGNI